ncbi:MAG: PilZ domain-containing protein [Candidatus Methylomirabilales bacterium]
MRQRFPRYPIQVPVFFRRLDQEKPVQAGVGMTEELGEGGASLFLEAELPMGCRLGLLFFVKGEIVESEARVVWTQARDRETFYHDVEFIHLTPGHLTSLLTVLPQEKSLRRQGVRIPMTLQVSCQVVGAESPPLEGLIQDISRIGVMLTLSQRLSSQTPVEMTLRDLQEERIPGVVQWANPLDDSSGRFSHGIEFTGGPLAAHTFSDLVLSAFPKERRQNLWR